MHSPGQVVLDVGEPVGERESQLGDGVGARLGHVVAGDRHRIEVPDVPVDEVLLDVAHHSHRELHSEDAGVLGLVLFEDVGLDGPPNHRQGVALDVVVHVGWEHLVAGHPEEHQAESVVSRGELTVVAGPGAVPIDLGDLRLHSVAETVGPDVLLALLVDRRVEEEGQHHGGRTVDRHRHRCLGVAQVEPGVQLLGIVHRGHRHSRVPHLPIDVGPFVGILPVQGDRVEGGGEPGEAHPFRQVVEPAVGPLRRSLPGEHPGGVLGGAPQRVDSGRVGETARQVLLQQPPETVTPPREPGESDLGYPGVGEGFVPERNPDLPAPYVIDELLPRVFGDHSLPPLQFAPRLRVEGCRSFGHPGPQLTHHLRRALRGFQLLQRPLEAVPAIRGFHLPVDPRVV